jgi:hypothetical protein
MARQSHSQSSNQEAPVAFSVPEGFQRSGSANAIGWFNMGKLGNILRGQLLGMFERKDQLRAETGKSNFFQVQITDECEVRIDRGEDATFVMAKAGDVVNVNYGPKTKTWEVLIGDIKRGAVYEVYGVIAGSKVKLDGGRTMHNFDVFQKMVKAPSADSPEDVDFEGGTDASA